MTLPRPYIPLKVQRDAAIIQLGLDPAMAQLDHDPALGLRHFDQATGRYTPDANDPHHLKWRSKEEHRAKTSGRKGEKRSTSYGSDQHAIAKLRRLTPEQEDVRRRILAPNVLEERERPKRKYRWPQGRKLQSRKMMRGRT
jgi:hypothetical protein